MFDNLPPVATSKLGLVTEVAYSLATIDDKFNEFVESGIDALTAGILEGASAYNASNSVYDQYMNKAANFIDNNNSLKTLFILLPDRYGA